MGPESAPQKTTRDPKPTSERVVKLAERVLDGDIVLPEFQRPFVWRRAQVLQLLDSIYRNYPIGSLLVWESRQSLHSKRTIADLEVAGRSSQYPWNYLLDGQQRLSTVCGALNWSPGQPRSIWNLYFNLSTQTFHHANTNDELPLTSIPIRLLSKASEYFSRTSAIQDSSLQANAKFLFDRFADYQVPLVTLGDMSIKDVAPVFERINSTGTRLTIFDLMRAATWSTDFDLGKSLADLKAELEPKKFHAIDEKTVLRALAAATGRDFSAASMDQLRECEESELNAAVDELTAATKRAADFLATEVGAPRAEALPYTNQFAVLAEVFRNMTNPTAGQVRALRRWFWRTTIGTYFGGWNNSQMASDAKSARRFAAGILEDLHFPWVVPTRSVWKNKPFRSNSAIAKMLGLILGAAGPRDLLTGAMIDVDKSLAWSNDKEYHHFFPQHYLSAKGREAGEINVIANIVMLTSASNIYISDKAPSDYLAEAIAKEGRAHVVSALSSCLVSEEALDAALNDDYDAFLEARAATLHSHALQLCGWTEDGAAEPEGSDFDDDSDDSTTD